MLTKIYVIHDVVSDAFMSPFYSPQDGSAVRAVVTQLRDPNSMLAQHPADYSLYRIGEFDDQLGVITAVDPIHLVGRVSSFLYAALDRPETLAESRIGVDETTFGLTPAGQNAIDEEMIRRQSEAEGKE